MLRTIPGGDAVRDSITLDLCGADFPSEALRDSRLQQTVFDKDTLDLLERGEFSIESVVYDDAASGSQAFEEIRGAVASCPHRVVLRKVPHSLPVEFRVFPIPEGELGEIAPDHIALDVTMRSESGDSKRLAVVYQRRGRVLVGLYGASLPAIAPFIPVVASRLAALTSEEAGE